MTGEPWDASYHRDEPAPWDVARPQPAFVRVASAGGISGSVLDAGCGTGENALLAASQGLEVLGVDVAETAVAMAQQKARDRGVVAEFAVADCFALDRLGRTFDTVLDSGMFHTCDVDERPVYVASVASVTRRGARFYVLCFSDEGSDVGPHPVSREDLHHVLNPDSGWNIVAIESEKVDTTFHDGGAPAWLATFERT